MYMKLLVNNEETVLSSRPYEQQFVTLADTVNNWGSICMATDSMDASRWQGNVPCRKR